MHPGFWSSSPAFRSIIHLDLLPAEEYINALFHLFIEILPLYSNPRSDYIHHHSIIVKFYNF